jgi:ornithine cyclodeaminase
MPKVTILTEAELRRCVAIDAEAIDLMADAFVALAQGRVVMPPILRLDIEDHNGDNGYLTDARTAAAGAVAARCLSREDSRTAGVIGSGTQARLQMQALKLVRDFERLLVWGLYEDEVAAYVAEMAPKLGVEVIPAESREAVVRDSDIVVTTTPSRSPLVEAAWLHPGLHITAMGADAEHKNELEPQVLARADAFVCDSRAQSIRLGELHHAVDTGAVPEDMAAIELGHVASGSQPGRKRAEDVTVCDLTGTGVQDTAIALLALRKATAAGLGTVIES